MNLFLRYIHFAIHTKFHDSETAHVAVILLQTNTEQLQINWEFTLIGHKRNKTKFW